MRIGKNHQGGYIGFRIKNVLVRSKSYSGCHLSPMSPPKTKFLIKQLPEKTLVLAVTSVTSDNMCKKYKKN
jgi:hypothetical protein